ncbi:MAG: cytochrome c [Enhydrobacter sp.]|jgi:mono/diheme cytochrome c family protein|nr:cytochrome c [Enhydrobacter sp.]
MRKRLFAAPRRGWRVIGLAGALLVVLLTGSAVVLLWATPVRIDASDDKQVALGKRLYAAACASCHGAALEGQPDWQRRLPSGRLPAPPHDASGHTWHHSDAFLMRVTQLGPKAYPAGYQTDMPAFRQILSDLEIAAILAFIKSQWPPDIRARQSRLNAAR